MREQVQKPENTSRTLDSNPRASKQAPINEILQTYKDRIDGKPVQRQSINEEKLLQTKAVQQDHIRVVLQQYKERNIQRYAPEEDEELIQGKFDTAQREEIDEEEILQGKFESDTQTEQEPVQREKKPNNTGLPDNLKTGIENLSGYSMDDVKVHYNSDKPAQLSALAYAQGTDIHVAPGQEKHLPHEAWHVVQQKQGRVQPTMQLQGVNVNDNEGLEREADEMGGLTNNIFTNVMQLKKLKIGSKDIETTKDEKIKNHVIKVTYSLDDKECVGFFKPSKRTSELSKKEKDFGIQSDDPKYAEREIASAMIGQLINPLYPKTELAEYEMEEGKDLVKGHIQSEVKGEMASGLINGDTLELSDEILTAEFKKSLLTLQAFDYLIGNVDRHLENYMIKDGKAIPIDSELSFSSEDLDLTKVADSKFAGLPSFYTDEVKEALGKITDAWIGENLSKILNGKQIEQFKKRLLTMRQDISTKEHSATSLNPASSLIKICLE